MGRAYGAMGRLRLKDATLWDVPANGFALEIHISRFSPPTPATLALPLRKGSGMALSPLNLKP